MPLECSFKQRHGRQFCVTDCPARAPCGVFDYVRVERPEDLPAADPRAIDVAVLDMNHGWPNLGHDSLVHAVLDACCDLVEPLREAGLRVRVLSYDVRRSGMVPEAPGGRFALYVGTGGPGHLDPACNDGVADRRPGRRTRTPPGRRPPSASSTPSSPTRRGADRGLPHLRRDVPLVGRGRAGAARPGEGQEHGHPGERAHRPAAPHPWFRRFAELPTDRRLGWSTTGSSISSRRGPARRAVPIGYETLGVGGPPRRRAHDARVRPRPRPAHAADLRGQPPPRDRGPLPADMILDQKRDRGEVNGRVVPRAARDPDPRLPGRERRPAAAPHLRLHPARPAALPPVPRRCAGARESLGRAPAPRGPRAARAARRAGRGARPRCSDAR